MAKTFVTVYDKRTGRKHIVPEHFIGHAVLGKDIVKTPRSVAAEKATPATTQKTPATPEKGAN